MNVILLGAPGAGKGTQAEIISQKLGIPTISTGNILREAVKNGTEIGLKAKSYMDAGALVPDEVIVGIVKERVSQEDCKNGFILDGMPRTIPQAECLTKALRDCGEKLDFALNVDVPDGDILTRMGGRRACLSCGATYHTVYAKPAREGICDHCGSPLVIREDDRPETVQNRLNVYHKQTQPLIDYYAEEGILVTVDGTVSADEVFRAVQAVFKEND